MDPHAEDRHEDNQCRWHRLHESISIKSARKQAGSAGAQSSQMTCYEQGTYLKYMICHRGHAGDMIDSGNNSEIHV